MPEVAVRVIIRGMAGILRRGLSFLLISDGPFVLCAHTLASGSGESLQSYL